ncbi:MAG: glycosyltransferase [Desulfofustis sp.]|nr:glycosyltransferase [Desulfofustis sp.]NNK56033.1 glycosyltransferase [Desulfofustis sp.]
MSGSQPTLAYILKGYPRISETFISNEILLLENLGFTIRLFPMRKGREDFCHESVKQIKARVDYLPTELLIELPRLIGPNIFCAVKQTKRYRRALATASRRFRRTRRQATFKHLFQAGYMTEKFLCKDPSICHLHGHFAHSPTSVTMFAAILSGLSFSFTAHAKDIYTSHPEQLREKLEQAVFVATCTRQNKAYLDDLKTGVGARIHCIYHGIDLDLFQNDDHRAAISPPYRLLTVARIIEKKGLPTVYQALRRLVDKGIDFEHTLIGDGDDRESVLRLIEELGLSSHCRWLGTKPHDEVLDQFRCSDLFILGSKIAADGDRDGIPNVLVESLAMGIPAVATNVSSIPEIVIDKETGLTVEQEDSEALSEALLQLLTDQQLRQRVINKGKALVSEHFDNSRLIVDLARLFVDADPRFENGVSMP